MKFYAVKVGKIPGIYTTWLECSKNVTGFSGAVYKSFPTLEEAERYIGITNSTENISENSNITELRTDIKNLNIRENIREQLGEQLREQVRDENKRLGIVRWNFDEKSTIFVDGAYNKHTKPNAYGSVTNHRGVDLIEGNKHLLSDMEIVRIDLPVGTRDLIVCNFDNVTQQNNGAELLSLVAGLRIALHYISNGYIIKNIASDSQLMVDYWSKGRYKREGLDTNKIFYIEESRRLREIFESYGGVIQKISADSGNPADLGYHVNKR